MKTVLLFLFLFAVQTVQAASVFGKWKTIDDKTGQPKSIVEIAADGEGLNGTILELINPKFPDAKCDKCEGERKDQPVQGMRILSGFKASDGGRRWDGGEVLDPNSGKVYRCKLKLSEDGSRLEVRGFIGISLMGRTQTWERVADQPK